MNEQYRVLELTVQNFMGLEVVELAPNGSSVIVTGPNECGKSSALDAIYAALVGRLPAGPEPIRKGTNQAVITLDLGQAGACGLRVTRKFGKGEGVTVESADGARFKSPQGMLDALMERLALDPQAFAGANSKEQAAILRKIVSLEIDPDAVLAEIAAVEDARRDVGRDLRQAQGHLATVAESAPDADPGPKRTAGDIAVSRQAEQAKADAIRAAEATAQRAANTWHDHTAEVRNLDYAVENLVAVTGNICNQIKVLQQQLLTAQNDTVEASRKAETFRSQGARFLDLANGAKAAVAELPAPDFAAIDAELDVMQAHNEAADAWARYQASKEEVAQREAEHAKLERRVRDLRESLKSALAGAEYPVDGMALAEDLATVLYNGLPLSQAPTSIQLLVGVKVAVAQNPQLRVLRIQHGNNLDAEHMQQLLSVAEKHGFQCWIERVADGGGLKFVVV